MTSDMRRPIAMYEKLVQFQLVEKEKEDILSIVVKLGLTYVLVILVLIQD
jgi:hypothetical protein